MSIGLCKSVTKMDGIPPDAKARRHLQRDHRGIRGGRRPQDTEAVAGAISSFSPAAGSAGLAGSRAVSAGSAMALPGTGEVFGAGTVMSDTGRSSLNGSWWSLFSASVVHFQASVETRS